jgi:hypothetical protein
MIRTIATSTLYVRTNRLVAGMDSKTAETAPPWCSGPSRIQRPEAFVASLGHLLDVRVGRCDHRTYEPPGAYYPDGSEGAFFPNKLREDEPSDALALGSANFHLEASSAMGGCNAGSPRTEEPTLGYVFGAAPAAAAVCGASSSLVPPDVPSGDTSAGLKRVADHVSMLLLGRPTTDDERRALASDASSCGAMGCDTAQLAVLACTAIARSLDFVTY